MQMKEKFFQDAERRNDQDNWLFRDTVAHSLSVKLGGNQNGARRKNLDFYEILQTEG